MTRREGKSRRTAREADRSGRAQDGVVTAGSAHPAEAALPQTGAFRDANVAPASSTGASLKLTR